MGLLDKLMFWKDDEPEVEPVPGYEVDGCFTLRATEDEATQQPAAEDC